MFKNKILVKYLGIQPYNLIFHEMQRFTNKRSNATLDEIWLVEHYPVFTTGKTEEKQSVILNDIPVIQSDRGGRITYHGPGQQIMYVLLNLRRRKINVHELILLLEQTVINTLVEFGIRSHVCTNAPGVYVDGMKICSLGLRVYKGCSLHGLALNVNMDLTPFLYINPCGHFKMTMTQMTQWVSNVTPTAVSFHLVRHLLKLLNNSPY